MKEIYESNKTILSVLKQQQQQQKMTEASKV